MGHCRLLKASKIVSKRSGGGERRRAEVQGVHSVKFPRVGERVGRWEARGGKGLGMHFVRLRPGPPGKPWFSALAAAWEKYRVLSSTHRSQIWLYMVGLSHQHF